MRIFKKSLPWEGGFLPRSLPHPPPARSLRSLAHIFQAPSSPPKNFYSRTAPDNYRQDISLSEGNNNITASFLTCPLKALYPSYQWRNEPKHLGGAIFARERSDQARGSVATERGEGVGGGCPR